MAQNSLVFALLCGLVTTSVGGLGCGHAPPPVPCPGPEPLRIALQAAPRLNLGDKDESLSTVVKIYLLKSTARLEPATFEDILDREREVLGDDLLASLEVTINPGEQVGPVIPRAEGASQVVVVALFRKPVARSWRVWKPLPPVDTGHCHRPAGTAPRQVLQVRLEENWVEAR